MGAVVRIIIICNQPDASAGLWTALLSLKPPSSSSILLCIMSNLPDLDHRNAAQLDPVLPFELFAHIIDDVASELWTNFYAKRTRANVISLSLVCHMFNELCRPHLFRLVEIDNGYGDDIQRHTTRHLASLLLKHPEPQHITSYIQHVTYSGSPISDTGPEFDTNHDTNSDFCHPLLQFPSVTTLYITLHHRYPYSLSTYKTRVTISSLFGSYIRAGTLTSLFLAQISGVPVIDLALCPNLRTLYLRGCTFLLPQQASMLSRTATNSLPFSLRTCVVRGLNTESLILIILSVCPRLHDLHLIAKGDPSHLNPLLENQTSTCAVLFPNLRSLELCYTGWDYVCDVASQEGLKAFPNLRSLSLFTDRDSSARRDPLAILQHVQGLEELHIRGEYFIRNLFLA
ncbi:hypothetical protein CVT24_005500 [Panaeolus cyanescens]|uniref:F-box domain-containing protein n=1 Tax=Panaeolus cyanescens TaxID=181874 RepID=A0A409WVY7_9AGAR|nr:hypothetical protein CVT24_005500 [Panaeolus cyanescens]